jgi:hypothetical protein
MVHEEAVRWSAWPALICYVTVSGCRLTNGNVTCDRYRRILWSAGWVALLIHVGLAFYLVHGSSWQAAYDHTRRATQAATGWNSGAGLWFNFATLLVWGLDLWLGRTPSLRPVGPVRSRWDACCQLYLAFMFFNATVVFGSPRAQVAGWLACGVLTLLAVTRPRSVGQDQ